jgi:hypothetical protein
MAKWKHTIAKNQRLSELVNRPHTKFLLSFCLHNTKQPYVESSHMLCNPNCAVIVTDVEREYIDEY